MKINELLIDATTYMSLNNYTELRKQDDLEELGLSCAAGRDVKCTTGLGNKPSIS